MGRFVPRQRKHKVLAREAARADRQDFDAEEGLPANTRERQAKRARIMGELQGAGVTKTGSKKAKRLQKYVDNKLKKDENRELLAKLAANKIDSSLFISTRNLGVKPTKKEALRDSIRRRNAGLVVEDDSPDEARNSESEREDSGSEGSGCEDSGHEDGEEPEATAEAAPKAPTLPFRAGSGLKRPLDMDDNGEPIIRKRQQRGGVKSKAQSRLLPQLQPEGSEPGEWEGFSDDVAAENGEEGDVSKYKSDPGSGTTTSDTSDSEDGSSSKGETDSDDGATGKPRISGFKIWAQAKRYEALGHESAGTASTIPQIPRPSNFTPRPVEQDPLPLELQPTKNDDRKTYTVMINRPPEVQDSRLKLPILADEHRIMEAIHNHDVVVISGATGSGKTTQVPQFLYEEGYGSPASPTPGMIGVTQPRRVAAVSMSKRVAHELGDHSRVVAYQIRYDVTAGLNTAIKFMTDGVLLREVSRDVALRRYSAIIIDEAHERSINTDVLIGLLSRVNIIRGELRKEEPKLTPLKLIIMSATLKIEDVTQNTRLFSEPPRVVEVEGRQFPVATHFSRKTHHDYVEEASKKICRGHRKLPPGGFLVFLTGQDEIHQLSKRLKKEFGGYTANNPVKVIMSASEAPFESEDIDFSCIGRQDFDEVLRDGKDDFGDDFEDEDDDEFVIEDEEGGTGPSGMNILPLYALLPIREQHRVFEPPPAGSRQVVIATNVAETSLTIPGIRYVFDCGRAKEATYNKYTSVRSFEIGWISKASANQRAGRAGRTEPGHCYRLYSSAVYERDFGEFKEPEILRTPLEEVVLRLKAMNVPRIATFPFPTHPDGHSLDKAEKLLKYLAALDTDGKITRIGSTLDIFPLSPRFARILLVGHLDGCLPYTVAMVAGLSCAGEVFIPHYQAVSAAAENMDSYRQLPFEERKAVDARTEKYKSVHRNFCSLDEKSDAIKLLQVAGEFAHAPTEAWCESHFVRFKTLTEIQKLRWQITSLLRDNLPTFRDLTFQDKLPKPTPEQVSLMKQMMTAGFIDQVAIRADRSPNPPEMPRRPTRAIEVPYLPLVPLDVDSQADDVKGAVYIHPSSPLSHLDVRSCPEYIVYGHLQKASASGGKNPKTRMHALTDITADQLTSLAKGTPLLRYGKALKEKIAHSLATERTAWVQTYLRAEGVVGMGWPLTIQRVEQKKVSGKGWVTVI